jgi:ketosteroid isomerase-like protein
MEVLMDAIQKEFFDIEKTMVKLFNAKQIDSILEYFSNIFVGFSSTKHERLTKTSQLKKTFLHYLDEGEKVKYSIKNLKVNIYGECALTTFYWQVDIHKKKKVKSLNGRASHVYMQEADDWKIVHEHFSKAH